MARADWARVLWATLGGLKEESRIMRVLGDSDCDGVLGGWGVREPGCIVWRIRNLEEDFWKLLKI